MAMELGCVGSEDGCGPGLILNGEDGRVGWGGLGRGLVELC